MNRYIVAGVCLLIIFVASFFRVSVLTYINDKTGNIVAKDNVARVVFTGDVMLGRSVEKIISAKGSKYLFASTTQLFTGADAVVINLEGPIMAIHKPTPAMGMAFSFASTTPKLLVENGINTVFLANNHLYDYGASGYKETVNFLEKEKIAYFGHPFSTSTEYVLRSQYNGQKIIFVGYNFTNPNFSKKSAVDVVKILNSEEGYLVVMIHGGNEYEKVSNNAQKSFYRSLIDAGADSIIAHHPHVTQEIELHAGKPIFYSLGNFIFDQYFSKDVQEGLVIQLELGPVVAKYSIIPVISERSRPRPMDMEGKTKFLSDLAKRSGESARASVAAGDIVILR